MTSQIRHVVRALRRSPGYTLCSLLVLAIGIGAATTAISVVGGVLLRPLPYRESDRLVAFWSTVPSNPKTYPSYPDVRDWGAEQDLFEASAYTRPFLAILRAGAGRESAVLNGSAVSPDFFTVMGAHAVLGRLLTPADGAPGAPPTTVLSYAQWVGRFGADSAVLGQSIDLTDGSYTVVGVAARGQTFPEWTITVKSDFYVPIAAVPSIRPIIDQRDVRDFTRAVARLRPGVSVETARARLRQVAQRLSVTYPEDDRGFGATALPLREDLVGNSRPALIVLAAAVGLVLLIACANVANLSLVRATTRARDLAVRAALGAGRDRIVRHLLLESAILATGGGILGVLSAVAAVRILAGAAPVSVPRVGDIAVDGWALAATVGITALAAFLSGLVPALVVARADLFTELRGGTRGTRAGRRAVQVRAVIVTGQLALALVLLAGAALLVRSFLALQRIDPGYDPRHLAALRIWAPPLTAPDQARRLVLYRRVLSAAEALPGIQSITLASELPLAIAGGLGSAIGVDGGPMGADTSYGVWTTTVMPKYFSTLGIPRLRGRDFVDADMRPGAPVALVSEETVRRYWPNTDPVGHQLRVLQQLAGEPDFGQPIDAEVIGIVGDVKHDGLEQGPQPAVYLPITRPTWPVNWLIVRTAGPPAALLPALRRAVVAVDPDISITESAAVTEIVASTLDGRRFTMLVLGAFAGMALVLAAVGVYGVTAYAVSLRASEIGIRVALGARHGDIIALVVGQGARLAGVGIGLGLLGAIGVTHFLSSLLFGVSARDPMTLAVITAVLGGVTLAASYLPARRAARVDPVVALRSDG